MRLWRAWHELICLTGFFDCGAAILFLHQLKDRRRHCFDTGTQSWFRQRFEQT